MQYARIPIPTIPPIRLHIYIAGPVSRMSWHMLRCTWNMHGRITVFFGEQNIPSSSSIGRRSSAVRTTQTQTIPSRHGRAGLDGPSSRSPLTSQAHFEFVTFEKTERMSPSQPANVCEAFCSCLQVTATRTSPEREHCVARIKSGVRFPPALFPSASALFVKDAFGRHGHRWEWGMNSQGEAFGAVCVGLGYSCPSYFWPPRWLCIINEI